MLRPGSRGEAVRDLQVRLGALGHEIPPVEAASYGDATERVVRAFQDARGLRVDGICGPQTWAAVVESGWRLGDRLLYRRRPMLRGDDVAELQRRLNGLGFDAGREDGILGDDTTPRPDRVPAQHEPAHRRHVRCRHPRSSRPGRRSGRRLGGDGARARSRCGAVPIGSRVVVCSWPRHPGSRPWPARWSGSSPSSGAGAALDATGADDPVLAAEANRYAADLFLAFRPGDTPGCRCSYFESGRFRSEAGHAVAEAVSEELSPILGSEADVAGRAYAVLRETRMAAVICEPVAAADVDGMRALVVRGADVAHAVVRGVRRGVEQPPAVPPGDD